MTTYKKVKASTLRNSHLPFCRHCLKWYLEHKEGTYSYTPQCKDGIKNDKPEIWQHYGAGCPNFMEK